MCIFAAFNLPGCAAEIALRYRDRLSSLCDVEHVLDLLAVQAQGDVRKPLTYREYMERFDAQDAMFYPAATTVAGRDGAGELIAVRTELESVKAVLAAIEGSKFWKLRKAWVKLKALTGLAKSL